MVYRSAAGGKEMTDQEKFDRLNSSSSAYLEQVIEDNYRLIYVMKRDISMAKNILLNRGEDISDMKEYADTPTIPWME
jgi:hypothetical protein